MKRKTIFISYSHKDEKWKDRLLTHLNVLDLSISYDVWDDRRIEIGTDWLPEIEKAMNEAVVAILMISANFLTSEFIRQREVPRILERRETEGLTVIPIIVNPCAWSRVSWLAKMQVSPKDGKPLTTFRKPQADEVLTEIVKRISDILNKPCKTGSIEQKSTNAVLLTDLPRREIELIGRDDELQMLAKGLNKANRVLLVNGLGGIGKTEICKRFFLCNYKQFTYAAWIDYVASIKESMVNSMGSISKRKALELNESDTLDERFQKIMEFLKNLEVDTLLVIDNIENAGDEHLDTLKTLPSNIKVIVNSRLQIEGFERHPLDFLSVQSCKDLFYSYYEGERDDSHLEKLIEMCGSHTLSVELLARTARNAALSVKSLYETLEDKGFNLNEIIGDKVHTFWHKEKERKRFFNHLLMVFDLSGVTDDERHILVNLSVLPSIFISIKDISEWMGLNSNEEINALVGKGWLKKSGVTIFMHQVIQEVMRYNEEPDAKKCEGLIIALARRLSCEPGENPLDKKEFVLFAESLLGHIVEDNDDLAALANNLSNRYRDLGQLEKALEYQGKAVAIREKVLAKDHPDVAQSYNNLSTIYYSLGQLEKALEFQGKAVKIWEKVLDKDHPSLATSYNNLSLIYRDLGQLEKALEYQGKAVAIREKVLAKDHPDVAQSYNNLSGIYQDLGQLEKALEYQGKAVAIREKVLDKDHPDIAQSYNNLSLIYKNLGQLEKALEYQLKDKEILEKILAKDHPSLATSYNNLSLIYRDLGQLEKALEFQGKAVAIREKVLAKDHPDLAISYNNLALIYRDLKDYNRASQYAKQAVAILQHLFPNGHPNLDIMKKNLEIIKKAVREQAAEKN